ncbi:MAG: iron ABC transporter permease [Lachnospiraceae bacterium]|nr:iron ABC transporter permease [Lachnospiraceae bacterium]
MKKKAGIFFLLTILLLLLVLANICIGSIKIPLQDVFHILSVKESDAGKIILQIRLPRTIAALFLGGGLALSGYLLQTFFHNPIAGPFVLGISSGAKLVVALLMVYAAQAGIYLGSGMMIFAALVGALLVTVFVLLVSSKIRNMSILIVCGVMVGYICSAITEFVISKADDANIVNLHSWSMGSFSGTDWQDIYVIVPAVLIGLVVAFVLSKRMEAYLFGEEYAVSLGIHVKAFRVVLILLSSILSAVVTAFAGPVSFVGIAVPHIMREVFQSDRPLIIIPASFLGGGIFCLLSDLLARTLVAPAELSISTVTAVFGAPVVIVMLFKRKQR